MGVVVVASGSSPSAYIRGLIRRIDRGDPNGSSGLKMAAKGKRCRTTASLLAGRRSQKSLYNFTVALLLHCFMELGGFWGI